MNQLKSHIISIQLSEYIDEKLEWNSAISDRPVEDKWRIKVLIFQIEDTKVQPKETIMKVKTRLIDVNKNEYTKDYC